MALNEKDGQCTDCNNAVRMKQKKEKRDIRNKPKWGGKEFVCGYGAAVVNVTVTFPLNKVMFRQQLHGIRVTAAVRQLQREGVLHLYRGLLPPLLQKTTSMALMFGMYDSYARLLVAATSHTCPDMLVLGTAAVLVVCTEAVLCLLERLQTLMQNKHYHAHPRTATPFTPSANLPMCLSLVLETAALLAGCTEAVLCPFERVQTLMQNKHYHPQYRNTLHAFSESANVFSVPDLELVLSTAAVLAGCTEAVLCPFERVQTLMQNKQYHTQYRNTLHAFAELQRIYGFKEFFRGLTPILLRNGPSNVMFFLCRDKLKDFFMYSRINFSSKGMTTATRDGFEPLAVPPVDNWTLIGNGTPGEEGPVSIDGERFESSCESTEHAESHGTRLQTAAAPDQNCLPSNTAELSHSAESLTKSQHHGIPTVNATFESVQSTNTLPSPPSTPRPSQLVPKASATEMSANFISGAILGATLSTIFYPVNVVKTRMQQHVGGAFLGMRETFHVVFAERERSWRSMFRGVNVNFTRSFVSWGIINTSYEYFKRMLYPEHYY